MMHWYGDGMMSWGSGTLGGLATLIVLALAAVGIVALLYGPWRDGTRLGRRTPEEVLDERLARSEIDIEEYTQRRDLLRSARSLSK